MNRGRMTSRKIGIISKIFHIEEQNLQHYDALCADSDKKSPSVSDCLRIQKRRGMHRLIGAYPAMGFMGYLLMIVRINPLRRDRGR